MTIRVYRGGLGLMVSGLATLLAIVAIVLHATVAGLLAGTLGLVALWAATREPAPRARSRERTSLHR